MRIIFLVFLLISGCVAPADSMVRSMNHAVVFYSDFDIVASSGVFDLNTLKDSYPTRKDFNSYKVSSMMKIIEARKVGLSTSNERRQMRGPIYLAIYRAEDSQKPLFISDGCYLLNNESNNIFEFGPELADFIGIPLVIYDARLCSKPGLGIRLSPR